MHGDINCEAVQQAMRQGRALTAEEQAHVDACSACLSSSTDAWLDAAVVAALETKPEVRVPEGFAAKVVAGLPETSGATRRRERRSYEAQWGLWTAAALVAVGLFAAAVTVPAALHTQTGMIFEGLVAAEIAGIALWLSIGRVRP